MAQPVRREAVILETYLAEEGPRSSAGDRRPRRAHKRFPSAGPQSVDRRRAEASAVSDRKRVGVVHEHDILRRGIAVCLEEDQSLKLVFSVAEAPPPEQIDVAVVSFRALSSTSFECPVVVFHEGTLNPRSVGDAPISA